MTFQFVRPEGGDLGLESAIQQALQAESNRPGREEWPSSEEIGAALLLEILAKQKAINDRHEVEVSTWKKHLVEETTDLRRILEDRRNRVRGILDRHFPGHNTPEGDVIAFARLDVLLTNTARSSLAAAVEGLYKQPRPHRPE